MKSFNLKFVFFLFAFCLLGFTACKKKGSYYETFYAIQLNKDNRNFKFLVKPNSSNPYRIMMILYPKNDIERKKIFSFYKKNPPRISASVKITDNGNNIILQDKKYVDISAYDNDKFDFYLINNPVVLSRNIEYTIDVEFGNLNEYELFYIDTKLAFGLGRFYKTNLFH
ncbi:hypothetical protein [Alysiella filiformis]|uniref:Lipoprotein n=1 Tax=Alysiella filiformis DSM 16848 TaxID=1120981 RepID=A0A286ED32_9NEIS|nr:hypothetical protein [Alysiella filiformis]QMT31159.1 hypothetical protein H3L97_10660 [Alysiella filiformis]UBQ55848.1 hypothetical protein JF568_09810 [Alysiella filiformis DSM 16848]SOD68841.1 hypothetical protein SAMN02746062_01408 [Alysiella filiformis DSM 16848]